MADKEEGKGKTEERFWLVALRENWERAWQDFKNALLAYPLEDYFPGNWAVIEIRVGQKEVKALIAAEVYPVWLREDDETLEESLFAYGEVPEIWEIWSEAWMEKIPCGLPNFEDVAEGAHTLPTGTIITQQEICRVRCQQMLQQFCEISCR